MSAFKPYGISSLISAMRHLRGFRTFAERRRQKRSHARATNSMRRALSLKSGGTHAGLIERAEYRLKAIAAALSRVEEGLYGICEGCGEDIPVDRLKVLPLRPTVSIASRSGIDSANRVKAISMSRHVISGPCPRKWMNRWKSRMR